MLKRGFTLTIILMLSSCSSINSKNNDEETVSARTAKINAQLGIAYMEQHNLARAKKKLLLALKQDPSIPEPWYSMGYFMEATGNISDADHYYKQAIQVAHGRGDTENNYGTFLCRTGKYKESIVHFMNATKDPEYLTPADAYENAGLCAVHINGDNHAVDYFNRALAQDPERPLSLLALAEINFKNGNLSAARSKLKDFLLVSPPNERSIALNEKLGDRNKVLA